jgi:hypothetical protein
MSLRYHSEGADDENAVFVMRLCMTIEGSTAAHMIRMITREHSGLIRHPSSFSLAGCGNVSSIEYTALYYNLLCEEDYRAVE